MDPDPEPLKNGSIIKTKSAVSAGAETRATFQDE